MIVCVGCGKATSPQPAVDETTFQNCDAVVVLDYPDGGWQGPLKWTNPSQLSFSVTSSSLVGGEDAKVSFDVGASPTKTTIGDSTSPKNTEAGYFVGVRVTFFDRNSDAVIESKLHTCLFTGPTQTLFERDEYRIRVMSREAANEIYNWGE